MTVGPSIFTWHCSLNFSAECGGKILCATYCGMLFSYFCSDAYVPSGDGRHAEHDEFQQARKTSELQWLAVLLT